MVYAVLAVPGGAVVEERIVAELEPDAGATAEPELLMPDEEGLAAELEPGATPEAEPETAGTDEERLTALPEPDTGDTTEPEPEATGTDDERLMTEPDAEPMLEALFVTTLPRVGTLLTVPEEAETKADEVRMDAELPPDTEAIGMDEPPLTLWLPLRLIGRAEEVATETMMPEEVLRLTEGTPEPDPDTPGLALVEPLRRLDGATQVSAVGESVPREVNKGNCKFLTRVRDKVPPDTSRRTTSRGE